MKIIKYMRKEIVNRLWNKNQNNNNNNYFTLQKKHKNNNKKKTEYSFKH